MALLDATPVESPDGIAIASGAVLTALMEALIREGFLNKFQAVSAIMAAQREVGRLPQGSFYDDARFVLKKLLLRFPAT